MKLTEHFTLQELTHSDTAIRLGIDNTPPASVRPALQALAEGLELVREAIGWTPMKINSGFRCEALERVLCAKDFPAWCRRHGRAVDEASWGVYFARKAHPKGYAADFTAAAAGTPPQLVAKIRRAGIRFDQLIEEGTWVHISFAPAMRREVLTARFDAGGTATYAKG